MLTELVLDVLVAVLLGVTVAYCFLLNRRLGALRNGQDGLLKVVRELNGATEQARLSIRNLQEAGDTVGEKLTSQVAGAKALSDELTMIVEAGNNLADRLASDVEGRSSAGRKSMATAAPAPDAPAASRSMFDPENARLSAEDKAGEDKLALRNALRAVR